jgi:hypothetical protein
LIKAIHMRPILRRTAAPIIAGLILSTTVIAASPRCRSSDFACFKRKMMRQVGRKIKGHFFFDIAEVKVKSPRAPAEITFREMRLRKPPLAELYFDITLHNDQAGPRWVLLPSNLGPGTSGLLTKGGVDTVEVFAPRGSGRVIVGHFLGTGGFYALLLPARAEVRLQMFPISYWGDPPDQLQVEVVTAQGLTIGGEPAAAWFGLNPTCSARAAIVESALSPTRMIRSRHSPDRKEVKALSVGESRFRLEVPLKGNK